MKQGDEARERILTYVKAYWELNKSSPSKADIMRALGISSQAVVDWHLKKMAKDELIVLKHGQHRAIIPVGMVIYFQ